MFPREIMVGRMMLLGLARRGLNRWKTRWNAWQRSTLGRARAGEKCPPRSERGFLWLCNKGEGKNAFEKGENQRRWLDSGDPSLEKTMMIHR